MSEDFKEFERALKYAGESNKAEKPKKTEAEKALKRADGYVNQEAVIPINDISIEISPASDRKKLVAAMMDSDTYSSLMLTKKKKKDLEKHNSRMATGMTSSIAMRCTAHNCPFADQCFYQINNLTIAGTPCKLEHDMLVYHTARFLEEFDVDPRDHSEVIMIQELAELIIYETRANMVLAKPENAELFGIEISFSKSGDPIEKQVEHWAIAIKEKFKTRRMNILKALNATRESRSRNEARLGQALEVGTYSAMVQNIYDKLANQGNPKTIIVEDAKIAKDENK